MNAAVERTFWAYRHTNGHIFLRPYPDWLDDESAYQVSIGDALESPFVEKVVYPFKAKNRAEAAKVAFAELRIGKGKR